MEKKPHILIVEDDHSSYHLLKAFLDEQHMEHLHASSGFDAIDFCNKHPEIKLVFLDIRLPDVDGYTVTREIKRNRPNLPVVAVTACAQPNDREQCYLSGCDDYIPKPVDLEMIKKAIDRIYLKN